MSTKSIKTLCQKTLGYFNLRHCTHFRQTLLSDSSTKRQKYTKDKLCTLFTA